MDKSSSPRQLSVSGASARSTAILAVGTAGILPAGDASTRRDAQLPHRQDARATAADCRCVTADGKITCAFVILSHAKNPADGLCRPAALGLPVCCAALAAMAISATPTAFRYDASARAQFRPFDSRLRHCSPRHAADSDRNGDLGARARNRPTELASFSGVGRCDRDLSHDGLRLLVVALHHAHGAVLLAI